MRLKQLILGISTYIPWILRFKPKATGGTNSARYCYSIWLRHLVMAHKNGLNPYPRTVAELGPGDSLGIGIAALLSGCEKYYAFDVVEFANIERNLNIFEELIELFKNRGDIPGPDEFPQAKPILDDYSFPHDILNENILNDALQESRLQRIRESIVNNVVTESLIKYKVPWDKSDILENESVDMIYSQAVLEHVDDLENTYKTMKLWLKPTGFLSHQIDFRSHGYSKEWNGHWTYSDSTWKYIRGNRPYFLNRQPHSEHINLLRDQGFKIVCDIKVNSDSNLLRENLAKQFKSISIDDLATSGAFIQATKIC